MDDRLSACDLGSFITDCGRLLAMAY